MHLNELKTRIDTQAYVVDPRLVAEAVLRRGGLGLRQGGLQPPISPLSAADARNRAAQTDPRRMS